MCCTAGRRVVENRAVLRRIVRIARGLTLSHREAVLRPRCDGVLIVDEGHLVSLRVNQVVLNTFLRSELEEAAARVDIRRRQGLRNVGRRSRIVTKQLVVEVIHIFLVKLYIGAEGCIGSGCTRHKSAVYIALNVGLDLPSRRKCSRVVCRIDRCRIALQRRSNRRRDVLLLVDHLVGNIRMVHVHDDTVIRSGQVILKTRNLVRIQRHLARVTAANLIRDRRIAV